MIKPIRAPGLERLELQRLRDGVGRLYAALQEATTEVENPLGAGAWSPPVDLCETHDAISVRVELPGVAADQIKIGLCNTKLRICGEKRRRTARRRVVSYLCSERSYGKFNRIVPLRWTINIRGAEANLENGILTIRIPKLDDRRGAEFLVEVKEVVRDER